MAAVEVTITGTLYDKLNRTTQQVVLIGEASLTGLGVGGGPIIPSGPRPPSGPVDPGYSPPWAQLPVDPGYGFPIGGRPPAGGGPVDPGYSPPWAQVPPPGVTIPEPGSPPVILGGDHPSNPIAVPPAIVINYPGIGPVLVPKPVAEDEEE